MPPEKEKIDRIIAHCNKWDNMYKRLGAYGVAKLMMKTKSWKEYASKYPFDYAESWTTVKQLDQLADFLPDDHLTVEDEIDAKLEYEQFVRDLTPRQKEVWDGLLSGMNNREIEAGLGFGSNNTVRWYKHKIKRKYLEMKYNTTKEWICKDCAWQWREDDAIRCPCCASRSVLCTKKDILIVDD